MTEIGSRSLNSLSLEKLRFMDHIDKLSYTSLEINEKNR